MARMTMQLTYKSPLTCHRPRVAELTILASLAGEVGCLHLLASLAGEVGCLHLSAFAQNGCPIRNKPTDFPARFF